MRTAWHHVWFYLQSIVVSGEWHQKLPERWEGDKWSELHPVVCGHVFKQHGQSMNCQVLSLKLFTALHWHRSCHGQRRVHKNHSGHVCKLFSLHFDKQLWMNAWDIGVKPVIVTLNSLNQTKMMLISTGLASPPAYSIQNPSKTSQQRRLTRLGDQLRYFLK